jgi:hypothetical protein
VGDLQITLPDMPATMCSYLMCEKKLNFPFIFFGESEAAAEPGDGGGIVADGCFIAGEVISLV